MHGHSFYWQPDCLSSGKKIQQTNNFLFSYQKKGKDARGKEAIITPGKELTV